MKNWLELGVGIFLLSMMLYGHYKGFLRLAVSLVALIATLVIVNLAMPSMSTFLKEYTPAFTWIEEGVEKAFGNSSSYEELHSAEESGMGQLGQMSAQQQEAIQRLHLPQEMKEALIENNNRDVYQMLGVEAFTDYIGNYLANMVLNVVGYILLFIIVYLVIRFVMRWLDLVAKLPILSGINQLAGAALGVAEGLFYLWIACLILTACAGMGWATVVMEQIDASPWLSYLYHYNIISRLFFDIIRGAIL